MVRNKSSLLKAVVVTALVFFIFTGGFCERYERKMDRRDTMRRYIDSARTVEQLRKDSIRRSKQAIKQQQDSVQKVK